jgi:hypothetical protein
VGSSPSAGNALNLSSGVKSFLDFLFEELGEFPLKSDQQKDLESGKGKKKSLSRQFSLLRTMTVAGPTTEKKNNNYELIQINNQPAVIVFCRPRRRSFIPAFQPSQVKPTFSPIHARAR